MSNLINSLALVDKWCPSDPTPLLPTVGHLMTNAPHPLLHLPRTVGVGSLSVGWVAGWLAGGLPAQLDERRSANFFLRACGWPFIRRKGGQKKLAAGAKDFIGRLW